VSRGAAGARPGGALAVVGGVLLVGALAPPLATEARRVEWVEALQFAALAFGVPALVVLGAPWRRLGLAAPVDGPPDAEGVAVVECPAWADRVAASRRRHRQPARALGFLLLEIAAVVVWRVPATVDALAHHGWVAPVEAVTLVPAGIGLWLELVASWPLAPRIARPQRMAVAAVAMWVVWVSAYVVGLAHGPVYRAFPHTTGRGLSVAADESVTTGVLWFLSLCAYFPVIFTNLVVWLRGDDDPDEALDRLVRHGSRSAGHGVRGLDAGPRRPLA
jgi:cytochrome c oxidase assembly factor CtaG